MLRTALAQWADWHARGYDLEIAVNLSTWSLLDTRLADDLRALLDEHGVPARALRLEITESGIMTDPQRAASVLGQVSDLGIGLAIDDFGTGYSSLSWLSRRPVAAEDLGRWFEQRRSLHAAVPRAARAGLRCPPAASRDAARKD